jgi:hypothetical protein
MSVDVVAAIGAAPVVARLRVGRPFSESRSCAVRTTTRLISRIAAAAKRRLRLSVVTTARQDPPKQQLHHWRSCRGGLGAPCSSTRMVPRVATPGRSTLRRAARRGAARRVPSRRFAGKRASGAPPTIADCDSARAAYRAASGRPRQHCRAGYRDSHGVPWRGAPSGLGGGGRVFGLDRAVADATFGVEQTAGFLRPHLASLTCDGVCAVAVDP